MRLTGSGMGCPNWPNCTEGSLIPTDELSWHSVIEFGNRTLTGVLVIIALLAFLSVVRMRPQRPELFALTLANGLGIILQALVGGVIVWLHLPPSLVGIHFVISAAPGRERRRLPLPRLRAAGTRRSARSREATRPSRTPRAPPSS